MEGTFNCFTTLLPQSIMEMFQRKSPRPRKYQESLETCVIQRRISMVHFENKRGSPLAHNSVQAWSRKCFSQCKALTRGAFLDKFLCFHQNGRICWGLYYLPPNETVFVFGGKFEFRNDSLRHRPKLPWRNFMSVSILDVDNCKNKKKRWRNVQGISSTMRRGSAVNPVEEK